MPPNRKRGVPNNLNGTAADRPIKRTVLAHNNSAPWAWVGTEVVAPSDITPEHCLIACGLSERNNYPFCTNKYPTPSLVSGDVLTASQRRKSGDEDKDEDIIEISGGETSLCSAKACKFNPNCLNYLGQEEWENEGISNILPHRLVTYRHRRGSLYRPRHQDIHEEYEIWK
jgi:hypothetical protein